MDTLTKDAEVAAIALDVARRRFKPADIEEALSQPSIDFDGDDALQITVVTKAGALDRADDAAVVDALADLRDELQSRGDYRFPFIRYVTRQELSADGDS